MTCCSTTPRHSFCINQGADLSVPIVLTFDGTQSGNADAFTARLNALEQKVAELQQKAWTQEALTLTD